ncbi:GLPGLI family protein [Gaopeijia maritima]|uniref:GLPGLI family protein n=1 Tax=Gaopeijia maritima TaxID=3119007 RepID=A0ABU9E4C1_9BACT
MRISAAPALLGALLLIPSLASGQSGTIRYERSLTRTPGEALGALMGGRARPDGEAPPSGDRPAAGRRAPGGDGAPGGAGGPGGRFGEREPIQEYATLTVTYAGAVAATRVEPIESAAPRQGARSGPGGGFGGARGAIAQRLQDGGAAGLPAMPIRRTTSVWVDTSTGERVETVEFMGRTFRIRSEQSPLAWKLVGEESEFLGYRVQKATAQDGERSIEAWFTVDVPGFAAPDGYHGLPGTVLMVSVDRGATLIQAVEVVDESIETPDAPSDGEEMSAEEFDALVAEKTDEFRQEMESVMRRRRGGGL